MDIILIQKFLTQLAYPAGLIGLCLFLAVVVKFSGRSKLSSTLSLFAGFIFLLSSNNHIAQSLTQSLEDQYSQLSIKETPKTEAIIVLGGSFEPPLSPRKFGQLTDTSNRFWIASKLYKAGKANLIILSGGNVFNIQDIKPESHYIKEWLIEMGIPDTAIIMEDQSRTTHENFSETEKILKQQNINNALLMTSALHMPRSMQIFSASNSKIIAAPSGIVSTPSRKPNLLQIVPSAKALSLTTKALHEYYGMWKESLKSKLKKLAS